MNDIQNQYANVEDSLSLIRKDKRTPAERKLDSILEERGASEQGAEPSLILRQIALELLAEQLAQQEPVQRYSPDGEGRMEIDSLGAWVKFTSPPTLSLAQRKPLTDEQCAKCKGLGYYDEGHENDDGTMSSGNYVECDKCKPA